MNWQTLSANSHYKTAVAIKDELGAGNAEEATRGIDELVAALSRSDKRALKSQLVRLMMHIIKWQSQPERRSLSWVATINNARDEIKDIQDETPSLNNDVILALWDKAFTAAKREAMAEMGKTMRIAGLEWDDVFTAEYYLPER